MEINELIKLQQKKIDRALNVMAVIVVASYVALILTAVFS